MGRSDYMVCGIWNVKEQEEEEENIFFVSFLFLRLFSISLLTSNYSTLIFPPDAPCTEEHRAQHSNALNRNFILRGIKAKQVQYPKRSNQRQCCLVTVRFWLVTSSLEFAGCQFGVLKTAWQFLSNHLAFASSERVREKEIHVKHKKRIFDSSECYIGSIRLAIVSVCVRVSLMVLWHNRSIFISRLKSKIRKNCRS